MIEQLDPEYQVGQEGLTQGKESFGLADDLAANAHTVLYPGADPDAVFLDQFISRKVEMAFVVGMIEQPRERFEIKIADLKGEAESRIIPVKIIGKSIQDALVVRIMIGVVSQDENEVFQGIEAKGEMPVELRPFAPVVMRHKLGEKREIFGDENFVPESEGPPVVFPGEVVVAGKIGGKLKLAVKFPMNRQLFCRKQRVFCFVGAIHENFVSVQRITPQHKKEDDKCDT